VNLEPFLVFTRELAHASAEVILPYFGNHDCGLELKSDATPVTLADRKAEEIMRAMIEKRFPDHGIVGEEYGNVRTEAEFVWVLDPIDGTRSFITAVPLFGTLIGLLHQGRPRVGCIHQPVLKQLLLGDGRTTTLNGRPVRTRRTASLAEATVLITDPLLLPNYRDDDAYRDFVKRVRLVRTWGDCYGYLLLACGWADVMLDPILNPWDFLPLQPVIEGAGGRIADWTGRPLALNGVNSCISAVPELFDEVVRRLNP
jgi:myo-inositol-1(or 4)-monophosphatase